MTNDIVYTYRGSWCSEGLHTSWESDWRIIGTKGSVKWDGGDDMTADIVTEVGGFHSKCENVELPPFDGKGRVGGHQGLIHEFIECVQFNSLGGSISDFRRNSRKNTYRYQCNYKGWNTLQGIVSVNPSPSKR